MKMSYRNSKKRCRELDFFSAIGCLFVILIHVLSLGISYLDKRSVQLALIYLPWKLAAYVVPGFLFVGALKLSLSLSERRVPYLRYVLRRVTKIYIPYIIYVLLFYGYYIFSGAINFSVRELIRYIIWGNIASPFYYVVVAMQFYLAMPLWRLLIDHVPALVAVPSSLLLTLVSYKLAPLLDVFGISFPYSDRVITTYLFFCVAGLYAGKYYDALCRTLRSCKRSVAFCIVPSVLFSLLSLWQYRTGNYVYTSDANALKLVSDTLSVIFFLGMCLFLSDVSDKNRLCARVSSLLDKISSLSFEVYLCHCLFLLLAEKLMRDYGISDIGVCLAIRFAVCYTLPFLWSDATVFVKSKLKTLRNRVSDAKSL